MQKLTKNWAKFAFVVVAVVSNFFPHFDPVSFRSNQLLEHSILINWRASEASETLSGVTQLKIGDICLFIYMCVEVCMSFCTLTLVFLCLLRGLPLPILPLNGIFSFSDPYHSRNSIIYPSVLGCFWMPKEALRSWKLTVILNTVQ